MSDQQTPGDGEIRGDGAGEAGTPAAPVAGEATATPPARLRDEALSLAADELRGPAAVLLRQVRRLRRTDAIAGLGDTARRTLDSLERQAGRVARAAEALVELQAIEAGKVQLRRRSVDVTGLVARVARGLAAAARERSVQLVAVPGEPFAVSADPDRLAQAITGLLDAAVATTPRGGRVAVTVAPTAQGVAIELARTTDERRPGARRRVRGPGSLGFAVARRLAELHGGALDLDADGGGLQARLELPEGPPAARPQVRATPAAVRARVLVVDDDHDAREALALVLGDDYDVVLAADGQEALERAARERPDVVLMDLYMPRMDGLAALEALRADPATAELPVILISARGDEVTRTRSLDLGAVDFLQKPFSGRELKARIERTLRFSRRQTELQQLARTDPLTGLANLRAFRDRLDEEVKRARRYHTPLSCVMVDMDHLKPINDEMGHAAGDLALRAIAEVIRRELRETDFGARYGGDEFVLLLPHTSGPEARVFAERVRTRLHESPIQLRGRPVVLGASFGIAALGDEADDDPGDVLVRRADAALYAAKRAGRGRVAAHASAEGDVVAPT